MSDEVPADPDETDGTDEATPEEDSVVEDETAPAPPKGKPKREPGKR